MKTRIRAWGIVYNSTVQLSDRKSNHFRKKDIATKKKATKSDRGKKNTYRHQYERGSAFWEKKRSGKTPINKRNRKREKILRKRECVFAIERESAWWRWWRTPFFFWSTMKKTLVGVWVWVGPKMGLTGMYNKR